MKFQAAGVAFIESPIEIGGVRSRALVSVPVGGGSATLLCLHGWSDSADTFKPLLQSLSHDGPFDARVVALDFPGFGEAAALQPGPMLPQFVAFANAAFHHFTDHRPLIVVGQSLGGRAALMGIAAEAAAGRTTPVSAAIIIGPAPLKLPGWQQMLVRNLSLSQGVAGGHLKNSDEERLQQLIDMQKRTCFAHADRVPESVFTDYARHISPDYALHHIERLRQFGAEAQAPLNLAGVDCPVDLLWGEKDRIAPIDGAQLYLDALPQARMKRLVDCGHHAHLEQPDAVAAVIRGRLAELTAG